MQPHPGNVPCFHQSQDVDMTSDEGEYDGDADFDGDIKLNYLSVCARYRYNNHIFL